MTQNSEFSEQIPAQTEWLKMQWPGAWRMETLKYVRYFVAKCIQER